jgi:hypothetical protein
MNEKGIKEAAAASSAACCENFANKGSGSNRS